MDLQHFLQTHDRLISDIHDITSIESEVKLSSHTTLGLVVGDNHSTHTTNGVLDLYIDNLTRKKYIITDPKIFNIFLNSDNVPFITIQATPLRYNTRITGYVVSLQGTSIQNQLFTDNIDGSNTITILLPNTLSTLVEVTVYAIDSFQNTSKEITKVVSYYDIYKPVLILPVHQSLVKEKTILQLDTTNTNVDKTYTIRDHNREVVYTTTTKHNRVELDLSDYSNLESSIEKAYLSHHIYDNIHMSDMTIFQDTLYIVKDTKVQYLNKDTDTFIDISLENDDVANHITHTRDAIYKFYDQTYPDSTATTSIVYRTYQNSTWSDKQYIPSIHAPKYVKGIDDIVFIQVENKLLYKNKENISSINTNFGTILDIVYWNNVYVVLTTTHIYSVDIHTNTSTVLTATVDHYRSLCVLHDTICILTHNGRQKYIDSDLHITEKPSIDIYRDWYIISYVHPYLVAIANNNSYAISYDYGTTWSISTSTMTEVITSLVHSEKINHLYYQTHRGLARRYFAIVTYPFTILVDYVIQDTVVATSDPVKYRLEIDTLYAYGLGDVSTRVPIFTLDMEDTFIYGGFNDVSRFKF